MIKNNIKKILESSSVALVLSLMIFFLLLSSFCGASIVLDLGGNTTFSAENFDSFNPVVVITNDFDHNISYRVYPSISPPIFPEYLRELTVFSGETDNITLFNSRLDDSVPPGNYTVSVVVFDDAETSENTSINFSVTGTRGHLYYDVVFCSDAECSVQDNLFYRLDSVYVKIFQDLPNGISYFNASFKNPRNHTVYLQLNNSVIALNTSLRGTYVLKVTDISSDNYILHVIARPLTIYGLRPNVIMANDVAEGDGEGNGIGGNIVLEDNSKEHKTNAKENINTNMKGPTQESALVRFINSIKRILS